MITVPELEPHCGSWVVVDVRDPAAPVALCEVVLRATVDRLAELAIPGRIEILTAARWLGWFNRAVKLAGGVQPGPQHWIAARPPVDGSPGA